MMAAEEAEKNVKTTEATLRESEQTIAAERKEIENRAREVNRKSLRIFPCATKSPRKFRKKSSTSIRAPRKRHHGVALAAAVNETVRGCGMRLLPHVYQEVYKPDNLELQTCETCGAFCIHRTGHAAKS